MAPADLDGLVSDVFADLPLTDLDMKPYEPEDRDAEAAKIARLRRLRLAKYPAGPSKKPQRLIVTR